MGSVSANKLLQVVQNVKTVLAIELMIACQALDQRGIPSSPALERVKALLRKSVPHLEEDRVMYPDVDAATDLVGSSGILEEIRQAGIDLD